MSTNRRWSEEVLSKTGIDEKSVYPLCSNLREVCGKVSAAGAEATGLRAGTPVVAGAGDQAAGAVGMGIARAGAVSATIGTSGVVFASTDRPALDPAGRLHTFCHAIPGRWHVMGVTQAAGLSLRWYRDQFGAASPGLASERRSRSLRCLRGRSRLRSRRLRRSILGSVPDGRTHALISIPTHARLWSA